MKKTPLPSTFCPYCFGQSKSANDPWGDHVPANGDLALCLICGEISVFAKRGTLLRKPTAVEGLMIHKHPPAQALRASWLAARNVQ